MKTPRISKNILTITRRVRQAQMIGKGLKSRRHPIEAQIIPIRRCNLSCTYCNEFDSSSQPVPTEEMIHRVDLLARLGRNAEAAAEFRRAAEMTRNERERSLLLGRAASCAGGTQHKLDGQRRPAHTEAAVPQVAPEAIG